MIVSIARERLRGLEMAHCTHLALSDDKVTQHQYACMEALN